MLFKNLFISSLIISSIFLLANTLPIQATNRTKPNLENQNSTQNKTQNLKTQIEITKIEFEKANNLQNSWDKIQQIIQSDETSLTFDSQLNLSKINFNLPIPITKNDNLEAIINKNKEIRNSVLDSLIKQKNGEKDFLDSSVFDTTDKNMANLQEQMTILANLNIQELENLKSQNYNSDNLFANSLTITTNNTQNNKNIDQIASVNSLTIEQIDLTNTDKNDKRDQNLKSKIKLKSNKIAKKTNKLSQIQSENAKLSESNSTPISEIQSSFSSSSLAPLPMNLPNSISKSNSSSSSVSTSPIVSKVKDLLEISVLKFKILFHFLATLGRILDELV